MAATARNIAIAFRALGPGVVALLELAALLAGASLVAFGAWQIYRPAGSITAGVLLLAGVLLRARAG